MRRRMSVWLVAAFCVCVLGFYLWQNAQLTEALQSQQQAYSQQMDRKVALQTEQQSLDDTLATTGTDAFIENQARTLYNFMMPDELRLVIVNPEALYGGEEVPSR